MSDKWFSSIVISALVIVGLGTAYHSYVDADVKKACYGAAKTNTNLKCE